MRVNTQYQHSVGLNLLSQDQLEEIHLATLEVLDRVGVKVGDAEAIKLLEQNGASVDGDRVRIPAWMVQEALRTAPCRVTLSKRDGERVLFLEKGRVYYGTGSATTHTVDLYNGELRRTVKEDVANTAKISDGLENIDFVMAMALAADVPKARAFVHEFEAIMLNTTKPILFCANDVGDLTDIIHIAQVVAGSPQALAANPFLCLYAEPTSPLMHGSDTLKKLFICADRKVPMIYGPAVMMGATGPVTAAGALVVANCEILSGLVMHQLRGKGAPFIYGGGVPPMDMKTLICSYGAPEEALNCAAMAAIAQYYNLPHFSTAGCTDAQEFDQQAGMEVGFNLLAAGLAGSNLIHDLGYMGAGMTSSMELLVLCDETVGMVKHFLSGVQVTPDTLAMDVIERVGPGGNYFAEKHTFDNFKKLFFPNILNRQVYDNWQSEGAMPFDLRANQKARELLENHQVPQLPAFIIEKVKEIVDRG
jgi:trimethylamine--corrinoid protein Co-methyltransferase